MYCILPQCRNILNSNEIFTASFSRFEVIEQKSGCQFREHVPSITLPRDAAVFAIVEALRDVIVAEPPQLVFPERLTRLVARDSSLPDGKLNCKETFWWDGLQLVPPHHQHGLLDHIKQASGFSPSAAVTSIEESSEEVSGSPSTTSSEGSHSEEEVCRKTVRRRRLPPRKRHNGSLWQQTLSARSNQDLQRSHEERLLLKIVDWLGKDKSSIPTAVPARGAHRSYPKHIVPPAGIYTRLEAEWREANCLCNSKRTQSYVNKPKIKPLRIT